MKDDFRIEVDGNIVDSEEVIVFIDGFVLPREAIYNKYSTSIEEGESRHNKIENLDKQKPFVDIFSGIMIFPIVYYHSKYLEMDRWLSQ